MKALDTIINVLSKEEVRFYKLFVGRTNNQQERKDQVLFNLMRKDNSEDLHKRAIKTLKTSPNNLYQLKHRIYNDLNNSMVWQHIWKDKQSKSFSFVLLSRVYKNKGELELSFHYLKKAEKEAIDSELYEVLSIIYSEIIEISHELLSVDVDHYIELKRNNIKILSEIDEMGLLLAKIMYDIKTKQNFGKSDGSLVKLIKTKYGKISKEKNLVNSPRFRIRLFKMYSRLLLQERDYQSLEKFLIESYNEFGKDKLFNRSNHNEKLTLLTYLSNCLYKTKKYKQSLKYSEELLSGMKEYDSFLHDKYLFYYYNILVLNYAKTDKKKALDYLNKASRSEVIKKLPTYTTFIYLNTSLIYYQQKKYKLSIKSIARLIQQEDFLLLDKSFQLKLYIAELIIRLNINQEEIIEEKIDFIRGEYKSILSDKEFKRDNEVIDLISRLIYDKEIEGDIKRILTYLSDDDSRDLDIISYNDWMRELI
jgi:tetratricopeptide (TPR) repeat protein